MCASREVRVRRKGWPAAENGRRLPPGSPAQTRSRDRQASGDACVLTHPLPARETISERLVVHPLSHWERARVREFRHPLSQRERARVRVVVHPLSP
jgi:hypothetical protein